MGIADKIRDAETTNWLAQNLTRTEIDIATTLARISADIELKRYELGMTQKEFAKYMDVSQGMVSKWESGEYNFSIETLFNICNRLGLIFSPEIHKKNANNVCPFKLLPGNKPVCSPISINPENEEMIA